MKLHFELNPIPLLLLLLALAVELTPTGRRLLAVLTATDTATVADPLGVRSRSQSQRKA